MAQKQWTWIQEPIPLGSRFNAASFCFQNNNIIMPQIIDVGVVIKDYY